MAASTPDARVRNARRTFPGWAWLSLVLCACSDAAPVHETRTTSYADGSPWSEVEFVRGVPHGEARTWHPGGVPASEGRHERGALEGPWRYWRADGTLEIECSYARDLYHGPWTQYHADGETIAEHVSYQYGSRDGEWRRNAPDGTPIGSGRYDLGRKVGVWRTFYEGGVESGRETWLEGQKTGPVFGFYEDGSPAYEGETLNNKPVGLWKHWHANGVLSTEGHFDAHHLRTGSWIVRDEEGRVLEEASGEYVAGERVGPLEGE